MGSERASSCRDQEKKRRVCAAETVGAADFSLDRMRRQASIFPLLQEEPLERGARLELR